jgi:hypothetical protein
MKTYESKGFLAILGSKAEINENFRLTGFVGLVIG